MEDKSEKLAKMAAYKSGKDVMSAPPRPKPTAEFTVPELPPLQSPYEMPASPQVKPRGSSPPKGGSPPAARRDGYTKLDETDAPDA